MSTPAEASSTTLGASDMADSTLPDLPRTEVRADAAEQDRGAAREILKGRIAAALVLLWTAVLGYRWLATRVPEVDEYLSFFTDSQSTAARLIKIQLHAPISLDPPSYHLLSHFAMQLFGNTFTALRLPALLGFLLFQITLFIFVRRIAGWRSGVIAMLIPVMTQSFFYAAQGRPYGLLLGAYGLAMVCWQGATRAEGGRRVACLGGLILALVLGVTSHFFGLLILVPGIAGELARTVERRRADWPVVCALSVGLASVALVLPFERAAAEYRIHYYNAHVSWHIIPQSYAALYLFRYGRPLFEQHLYLVTLCIVSAILAACFVRMWRRTAISHEYVAIAAMALLPVFGYLLGAFITHTADVRYFIATLFAMMAALGIEIEHLLRRNAVFLAVVVLLGLLVFRAGQSDLFGARAGQVTLNQRFVLSPEIRRAPEQDPSRPIYIQSLADFYTDVLYTPDPELRRRFTLVYSQSAELNWLGHDTNYITAKNMKQFAPLSITSYRELLAGGGHPLVLNYRDGWDWLSRDLAAQQIPMRKIGNMLGGELDELDLTAGARVEGASPNAAGSLDRTDKGGVN